MNAIPSLQFQLKDVATQWSASVATGHRPPIEAAELMTQFLNGYADQLAKLGEAFNMRLEGLQEALHGVDSALLPILTGDSEEDPAMLSKCLVDCVASVYLLRDLVTELTGEEA